MCRSTGGRSRSAATRSVPAAAVGTAAVAETTTPRAENEAVVDDLPSSVVAKIDAYSVADELPVEDDRVEADSTLDAEAAGEDAWQPASDAEPTVGPAHEADGAFDDAWQPASDADVATDAEPTLDLADENDVVLEDIAWPGRLERRPSSRPTSSRWSSRLLRRPPSSRAMQCRRTRLDAFPAGESDQVSAEPENDAPLDDATSPADEATTEGQEPTNGRSRRRKKGDAKSPKRSGGGKGRTVGLKIGSSQIAAAVIEQTGAGRELVELARRPLATGIVVDGEVRDLDALASAVTAFFDQEKLPKKDVRIGLASNRIGVRTFDLLALDDEKRFDNAVRFKAHELLPVAASESALDYSVLGERVNEDGELMRRVLLVVAPRDQIDPYAEVARRAGIKLSGIDLEALALLRAFVEPSSSRQRRRTIPPRSSSRSGTSPPRCSSRAREPVNSRVSSTGAGA